MKSRTWFLFVSMLVFSTATFSMPAQTRLYTFYSPVTGVPNWFRNLGTSVIVMPFQMTKWLFL